MIKWFKHLFGESAVASMRRFIGLQAFYLLVAIVIAAIVTNVVFANMSVIIQIASYLFAIVMSTIVGTTITDLVGTIKASQLTQKDETTEGVNPYYNAYDPSEKEDKPIS